MLDWLHLMLKTALVKKHNRLYSETDVLFYRAD